MTQPQHPCQRGQKHAVAETCVGTTQHDKFYAPMRDKVMHCGHYFGCSLNQVQTNDEGDRQVPWEDLRYIFGEIMYGGHIVEDWDRRLASAYLLKYFHAGLSDGISLFPGFSTPPTNLSYQQVCTTTYSVSSCHTMVQHDTT